MNGFNDTWIQFIQQSGAHIEAGYKYKIFCVDLDQCGPTPGAWKITNVGYQSEVVSGGTPSTQYIRTITTQAAHGILNQGQFIATGIKNGVAPWQISTTFYKGEYLRPVTGGGRRFLVLKKGNTASTMPLTFPESDGVYYLSNSLVMQSDGPFDRSPFNGIWRQRGAPVNSTTLWIDGDYPRNTAHPAGSFTDAYVIDMAKTFVADCIPPAAINATSDALQNWNSFMEGVMDCDDFLIDHGVASRSEAFVLVQTANALTDPDLATSAQRICGWWTNQPGIPIAAGAGTIQFQVPGGSTRFSRV